MNQNNACNSNNSYKMNLTNKFRKLWEQHIMWTRSFIISTAEELGDLSLVTERLLRNPKDFARLLRHFYGNNQAAKFEKLFTEHLLIAADLVNAAKAGNATGAEQARKKWYKNADDIALFLSSINPCWSQQEWKSLLYSHLKMTEDEAVFRLNRKYKEDIMIYDDIQTEALKMADYMACGIRSQFCC